MKTIFVTIPMGLIYRNIVQSGIVNYLQKAGWRIVILTPAYQEPDFIAETATENIVVEPLIDYSPKGLEKIIVNFRNNLVFTDTTKVKLAVAKANKEYWSWFSKMFIHVCFGKMKWLNNILEKIDNHYFVKNLYQDLFNQYQPDLVFATNLIYHNDIELIKEAKKAGIKTVGMVMSWDNLTSKGAVHVKTDKLIVWNEIMKKEALDLAGFKEQNIFLSGVPQFDFYFQPDKIIPRDEFFAKNGLDPKKKLIVFGAGTDKTTPNEKEVIKILDDFIDQGKIGLPVEIMLRLHPKAFLRKEYGWVKDLKHIKSELPGRSLASFSDVWFPTMPDIWHMVNLLYHCDLVINTCSTFTIDGLAFDKPVINIYFDGNQNNVPYGKSIKRYSHQAHYRPIAEGGGVKLVNNQDELLQAINDYLKDPSLNQVARQKTLLQQAYIYDGQAAQRIANYLISQLS